MLVLVGVHRLAYNDFLDRSAAAAVLRLGQEGLLEALATARRLVDVGRPRIALDVTHSGVYHYPIPQNTIKTAKPYEDRSTFSRQ